MRNDLIVSERMNNAIYYIWQHRMGEIRARDLINGVGICRSMSSVYISRLVRLGYIRHKDKGVYIATMYEQPIMIGWLNPKAPSLKQSNAVLTPHLIHPNFFTSSKMRMEAGRSTFEVAAPMDEREIEHVKQWCERQIEYIVASPSNAVLSGMKR